MSKVLITDYEFDPANRKIRLPGIETVIPGFQLSNLRIITNLTDGAVVYLPQLKGRQGTWDAVTETITLVFDTSAMLPGDELQIAVNDPSLFNRQLRSAPLAVTGPLTNNELRAQPVPVTLTEGIEGNPGSPMPTAWNKLFNHYSFDPVNNKVRFPIWPMGYAPLGQNQIIQIVNITANQTLYSPSTDGLGGTLVTSEDGVRELVFDYDVTPMSPDDQLQIILAIPPAAHCASNKSVNVMKVPIHYDWGMQQFEIEPIVPVESQFDNRHEIVLDSLERTLQIVKMSADSVGRLLLNVFNRLKIADRVVIDNFESYATTEDLLNVWHSSHVHLDTRLEDDSTTGLKSMSFVISHQTDNEFVSLTYEVDQDWSERRSLFFRHRSELLSDDTAFEVRVRDADNLWAYRTISGGKYVHWHEHSIRLHELIPETSSIDFTRIRELQFRQVSHNVDVREYIDDIELRGADDKAPEIDVQWYDFGEQPPTAGEVVPAPMALAGGVTSRRLAVSDIAGIVETDIGLPDLTVGNYYGFEVTSISPDHQIIMLGSDIQTYASGKRYVIDELGNITQELNESLAFSVQAPVPSFYERIVITFDGSPGQDALLWVVLVDHQGKLVHAIANSRLTEETREIEFDCADEDFSYWWERGVQRIVGYLQGDSTTEATSMEVRSYFFHSKHRHNG